MASSLEIGEDRTALLDIRGGGDAAQRVKAEGENAAEERRILARFERQWKASGSVAPSEAPPAKRRR